MNEPTPSLDSRIRGNLWPTLGGRYTQEQENEAVEGILALIKSESDRILKDFAEYCHERYMGCTQVEDGWEYSYNSEVVTMLDEWRKKQ